MKRMKMVIIECNETFTALIKKYYEDNENKTNELQNCPDPKTNLLSLTLIQDTALRFIEELSSSVDHVEISVFENVNDLDSTLEDINTENNAGTAENDASIKNWFIL